MDAGGVLGFREHLARERSWWDVLTADEYLTDPLGRRSARGGQCECALRTPSGFFPMCAGSVGTIGQLSIALRQSPT
jgi:hypothetical protein